VKVAIIGLGYVGLPLAVRAAEVGHFVVGIDVEAKKVDALRAKTSYIEDVTDDRLAAAIDSSHLVVCERLLLSHNEFDVCVVTVPTPLKNGEPDLTYVRSAGAEIGRVLDPTRMSTVILESTSYPGTTEGPFVEAIASTYHYQPDVHYHLGFSPERIDPGVSEHTLENTPKLVSGGTPLALHKVKEFYDTIVETTVPVSSIKVAEMAKIFENLQAYVNIALVNEMAEVCHVLGIDVWETIDAAMTKGHSMARWLPGPGVGGHCLPVDSVYIAWLARESGRPFTLAERSLDVNQERPAYTVRRTVELLEARGIRPQDASVLILGVAYKPSVGDLRESPALDVVADLVGRGVSVTVVDPLVEHWTMTPVLPIEELTERLPDFDLVVVVTDHALFDFDKVGREAQQVLDTRNAVPLSDTVIPL